MGSIAWSLIVNQSSPNGPLREGGHVDETTGDPLPLSRWQHENLAFNDRYDREVLIGSGEFPAAVNYSEELKDLVRDCLRFSKDFRLSPRQVLDRVDSHLKANPGLEDRMKDVPDTLLDIEDNDGFEVGQLLVV